jgi:hypothetical protein
MKVGRYESPELRRKLMSDEYHWQRSTVLLTNQQAASLDEIAAARRRKPGCAISGSGLIRAIVVAVEKGYPELVCCSSETQLYERLKQ